MVTNFSRQRAVSDFQNTFSNFHQRYLDGKISRGQFENWLNAELTVLLEKDAVNAYFALVKRAEFEVLTSDLSSAEITFTDGSQIIVPIDKQFQSANRPNMFDSY